MANVISADPVGEVARFDPFRDFENLFGASRLRSWLRDLPEEPTVKMDVSENAQAYRVKAEIPGVRKEDIRVAVDGNMVTISAEVKREKEEKKDETVVHSERYYGRQSRSFTVRHDVDSSKASAVYENGVLELMLPKRTTTSVKEVAVR